MQKPDLNVSLENLKNLFKKYLNVIIVIVIIFAAFYGVKEVYRIQNNKKALLEQEREVQEEKTELAFEINSRKKSFEKEVVSLFGPDSYMVVKRVSEIASDLGMGVSSLTADETELSENLLEFSLSVRLKVPFEQLAEFIDAVEHNEQFLAIQKISVTTYGDDLDCDMSISTVGYISAQNE